ncbi:16S rRNA (adenine(1518)-N(6)/adenine(1519)-N(6))-dimethyltransferase RsmA [Sulfuriflexus sp.]|uniref:16S rRNA (adenine(1518)-N(6)/adenine(1519)-N(6))- dimethyltransferase RsmA n=1 Tax=Sulfuriflexus sp. TaxID=2015443 RepID=UPI0028CFB181|nr:16S rRNA (adenine(1518)-N(6)/adenine(1519)-N(6))-dimethyltransferase RsmA [Sulfuriflexus sp.]MDT8403347.1 16S rRNA (adenine(1518)-N(6)/adenine(1519)-N(6))-dimethyltransferase RsmA [Sulfuriflexus sp.]
MSGGHRARKRFGQNFLNDANIIAHIVDVIDPQAGDHMVEIGPGQAALTVKLLERLDRLDVIEIDRDLVARLEDLRVQFPGLTIHSADALRFDYRRLQTDDEPLRVVGNLPYNISTPLLFHLLEQATIIRDMHFMLQKEVVERMAAQPGGSDYGRLSIMVQYRCQVDNLFRVPPTAFRPAPKVDSAIVRLVPHAELPYPARDEQYFARLVNHAFTQRRKTLRKSLKSYVAAAKMEAIGIDPMRRPETLSIAEFVALANIRPEDEH